MRYFVILFLIIFSFVNFGCDRQELTKLLGNLLASPTPSPTGSSNPTSTPLPTETPIINPSSSPIPTEISIPIVSPTPITTPNLIRISSQIEAISNDEIKYPAQNTIDDNVGTKWISSELKSLGEVRWISYKFSIQNSIKEIDFHTGYTTNTLGDYEIQISNDSQNGRDGNWISYFSISEQKGNNTLKDGTAKYILDNPINAKWIRLYMTYNGSGAYGNSPSFYLSEVCFYKYE